MCGEAASNGGELEENESYGSIRTTGEWGMMDVNLGGQLKRAQHYRKPDFIDSDIHKLLFLCLLWLCPIQSKLAMVRDTERGKAGVTQHSLCILF